MSSSMLTYLLPWHWPPVRFFFRRSRKSETDYETILASVAQEVSQVQSRLTQIRTRERRAVITIPFYILVLWAAYTWVCWYAAWLSPVSKILETLLVSSGLGADRHLQDEERDQPHQYGLDPTRTLLWIPIIATPLLLLFGRRLVRWWYERIASAEESHLRRLRKTQRSKIDEIKKATRYDHLRMLLDKYDDTQSTAAAAYNTPRRPGGPNGQRGANQAQQQQMMLQKGLGVNSASGATASAGSKQQRRSMPEPPVNLLREAVKAGGAAEGDSNGGEARPGLERQGSSSDAAQKDSQSAEGAFAAEGTGSKEGSSTKTHQFPVSASMPHLAALSQASSAESHQALLQLQTHQASSPQSQQPSPLQRQLMQSHAYQGAFTSQQQQRTFLDKIADLMLGPDPSTRGPGPEQRYALICPDCHRHNGLCMKEDFEEIQYICPNCGRFNSNRPSTVPTSWPGRNRVDSNSSVRSFLFSAFGSGAEGSNEKTSRSATHRASGSHLPIGGGGKLDTSASGLQLPNLDSSASLPTTPSGRFATLQTDDAAGPKSADAQSSGESDTLEQQQQRNGGGGGGQSHSASTSSSYFMRSKRSLANMPEEESQEILMTPDQRDGDEEELPVVRRGIFGTNLRRRGAKEASSSSDSGAQNSAEQQQNADDASPPTASLLDDDEEADDSMERHRKKHD